MSTQEVNVQSLLDALKETEAEGTPSIIDAGPLILSRKLRRQIKRSIREFRNGKDAKGRVLPIIIKADNDLEESVLEFLIPCDERSHEWHVLFESGNILNHTEDETIYGWVQQIASAGQVDLPDTVVVFLKSADGTVGRVREFNRSRILEVEAGVERFAYLLGCDPSVLLPLTSFSELTIEMIDEICEQIGQDYEDDAWRDVVISRLGPKGEA